MDAMTMTVWNEALERLQQRYGRALQPIGETLLDRAIVITARARSAASAAKLLRSLRDADTLDMQAISEMGADELSAILPQGTASGTARRLGELARLIAQDYEGQLEQFFAADLDEQRTALRSINGLGPETIDTLLLAGGNIPVLPVTSALHRVGKRHGWIDGYADSESISAELGSSTFETADEYWQFHSLLEQVGKEYCRATPLCAACPLVTLLPESGMVEGE